MTSRSLFVRSLGVAATLAAVTFWSLNAQAEIVFGNLGASGTGALDPGSVAQVGSTTIGQPGNQYAIAFTTGTNPLYLTLTNVGVGLGDVEPYATGKLSLFADNAGLPTGSLLASGTSLLGPNGVLNFNLGAIALSANTKYWLTVEDIEASSGSYFSWLRNIDDIAPSGLNSSGYTFPAGGALQSTNGGTSWSNYSSGAKLGVTIEAVPEPSAIVMAGLGAGGLAMLERTRRRRRKAVHADAVEADDYLG
jgi:MYXO-CTERM domain-containing protein